MPFTKVPLTPAQKSFETAKDAVRAAIYAHKEADIVFALLDVALSCHAIFAREDPPFYSYWDLTKRYSVSRKTVETWNIPTHKFGRTIRFKRADVLKWESEHTES